MKIRSKIHLFVLITIQLALSATTQAQGTAFTYQGRLNVGTNAATGLFDLQFGLWDSPTGGNQQGNLLTNTATAVTNGLFTVQLDFGTQFSGAPRWLEMGVRSNGEASAFSVLAPRQPLTPTPYSIYAESANATNLLGTLSGTQITPGSIGTAQLSNSFSLWNRLGNNISYSAGFVGINTNAPVNSLSVNGGEDIIGSLTVDSAGLNNGTLIGNPSLRFGAFNSTPGEGIASKRTAGGNQNGLDFYTDYTDRLSIMHNGNVGIGVGATNAATTLQVGGTVTATSFAGNGSGLTNVTAASVLGLTIQPNSSGAPNLIVNSNGTIECPGTTQSGQFGSFNGMIEAYYGPNDRYGVAQLPFGVTALYSSASDLSSSIQLGEMTSPTNFLSQMTIDHNGNVGIGTNNPNENLTIANVAGYNTGLKLTGANVGGIGMAIENTTSGGHKYDLFSSGPNFEPGNGALAVLDETAGSYRLVVSPNGNVGIGVGATNAATTLQVGGTVTATSFAGNGSGLTNVTAASVLGLTIQPNSSGAPNLIVNSNGTIECPGTTQSGQFGSFNGMIEAYYGPNDRYGVAQLPFGVTALYSSASDLSSSIQLGEMTSPTNFLSQMTIDHNGNVGIGTTGPTSTLQVNGTVAASAVRAPGAGINTGTFAFIQRALATNIVGNQTLIFNPVCDGDPNAILIITHNISADTNSVQFNTTPVGAYYNGVRWAIYNEDGSPMALGRAFNVMVIKN